MNPVYSEHGEEMMTTQPRRSLVGLHILLTQKPLWSQLVLKRLHPSFTYIKYSTEAFSNFCNMCEQIRVLSSIQNQLQKFQEFCRSTVSSIFTILLWTSSTVMSRNLKLGWSEASTDSQCLLLRSREV
jgi:hypothetical protein